MIAKCPTTKICKLNLFGAARVVGVVVLASRHQAGSLNKIVQGHVDFCSSMRQ